MRTRIRTVKPDLFQHDELYDLEAEYGLPLRLAFIALFCCCDRDGRFRWKPRQLKLHCLPYDSVDFADVLGALVEGGFVEHYQVDGDEYGCIPTFTQHQVVNNRETESDLPEFTREARVVHASSTREEREGHADLALHKGNGNGNGNIKTLSLRADQPDQLEPKPRSRFKPPTVDEVTEHLISKGFGPGDAAGEAEYFVNFYESKGWKVGKNPMVQWKGAATNLVTKRMSETGSSAQQADQRSFVDKHTDTSWADGM